MRVGELKKNIAVLAAVGVIGMCQCVFADTSLTADNLSEIGTGGLDTVYKITVSDYTSGDTLLYSVDGGSEQTVAITNGIANIGTFNYGVHNVSWKITNGSNTRYSKTDKLTVMKPYTKQFMDEFNVKGVATHMARITVTDKELNLLKNAGIKSIRDGITWYNVEKQTDVFDYTSTDAWINPIYENGIEVNNAWAFNNIPKNTHPIMHHITGKYVTETGYLPRYQKDIEPFNTYINKTMEKYPQLDRLELWNEPNGAGLAAADYTDLAMNSQVTIKRNNRWADLAVLSLMDFRRSEWTGENFKSGIYPYMDSIAFHPYVQTVADTGAQEEKCNDVYNQIVDNGGWKGMNITEVGWSTFVSGVSEDEQAIALVKQAVLGEKYDLVGNYWYDFIDDGTNTKEKEHFFGIVDNNRNPKASYVAFTQLNNKTAGALYMGECDFDGSVRGVVYLKDAKPLLVVWSTDGNGSIRLDNNAQIEDIYGNSVSYTNGTDVQLGKSPVYVSNLQNEWLNKTVKAEIARETKNWNFSDASENTKTLINTAIGADLVNGGSNDNKRALETIQDSYKTAGLAIIADAKANKISAKRASTLLFELYRPLRMVNRLYAYKYGENALSLKSDTDSAVSLSNERYYNDFYMMPYSENILRYARKYHNDAITVTNMNSGSGKNGIAQAWDTMSCILTDWFNGLSEFEEKIDYGLILNIGVGTDSYTDAAENGKLRETAVTVVNKSNNDFEGKLVMYDDAGNEIYRTKRDVKVKKGESCTKIAKFTPNLSVGTYTYTFKLIDNDGKVHTTRDHEIYIYTDSEVEGYPNHSGVGNYTTEMYPRYPNLSIKANESSNTKNVFEIGGRRFVLLDKDSDGNYFVAADEAYCRRAFNTTSTDLTADDNWKYDPTNSTNIAYWLNNDFLSNGTTLGNVEMSLPTAVKDSLKESTWTVEGCEKAKVDEYKVSAKVSLMSATEWFKYADILGYTPSNAPYAYPDDDGKNTYVNETGQKQNIGWYLRTPIVAPVYGSFVTVYQHETMPGLLANWSVRSKNHTEYIRPVFWLNSDFFTKNKSNVTSAGEIVQQEMK